MGKRHAFVFVGLLVGASSCVGGLGDDSNGGGGPGDQDSGIGADGSTCADGSCTSGCPTGFADCDGDSTNGCETNTASDVANCGACHAACGAANTAGAPTCAKGACVFTCAPGYMHCATDPSKGCDTTEDGSNCERCGHSCGGVACTAGVCDTIPIATGQSTPMGISIDSGRIYWAENTADKIRSAGLGDAVCNGTACTLVADTTQAKLYSGGASGSSNPKHHPVATSSTGSVVYFTCADTNTGALSVPVGGGEVDLSGYGTDSSYSILAENGYVFYTNRTGTSGISIWDGSKSDVAVDGTTQSTGQTPGVDALAADTGLLYFADGANGLIFSRVESAFQKYVAGPGLPCDMNQGGTAPICGKVIDAPGVKLVAVSTGNLFWSDATTIHRYKFLDQTSAILATNQSPVLLKADASGVYWGNSADNSFRTAKATDATCDGAACKLVVASTAGTTPSGLALDMQNIYVSFSGSGLVARRVK